MFAARRGDVAAGRLLLAHGADVNEVAADGSRALHVATLRSNVAFAKLLLDASADPNADNPGYTALHWAAGRWDTLVSQEYAVESGEWSVIGGLPTLNNRVELITALLRHGADPNARLKKAPPRFGAGPGGAGPAPVGATPFHLAAYNADVDVMRLLLANGADPSLKDNTGVTALIASVGTKALDVSSRLRNDHAPERRHLEAVRLCMALGGDINAATARGETALHVAAAISFGPMIQFLVENGAIVNAKDKRGDTPLGVAYRDEGAVQRPLHENTLELLRKLGGVRN